MVGFQRSGGMFRPVISNRARHRLISGRLSMIVGGLAVVATLMSTSPASAGGLPTMLALRCGQTTCKGVYEVRPSEVSVQAALDPAVTLSWSSWTSTKATASGTWTTEVMGFISRGHIRVVAYDVKAGHFSVLRITFVGSHPNTEVFVPGIAYGLPGWVGAAANSVPPVGSAPPVTPPPSTTGPPTISGAASANGTLTCSGGSLIVHATKVTYQWVREGTPIPGAATRLYKVRKVDEGLTLTCLVTAYAGGVVTGTATSGGTQVAVPVVSGCPAATGSLSQLVGLLGTTRATVLHTFARSSSTGQQYEDLFCLTPFGVLVGYPPPGLLASLPAGQRGLLTGRVVWISTANAFYSLLGVRPGMTVAAAGTVVTLTGPFSVGSNVWYLAQDGAYVVVLIVRGGIIAEVGITDSSLAQSSAADAALLNGLQTIYRQSVHVAAPLEALDAYWDAIGAHSFLAATGYVLPGVLGSASAFVSSEQHERVQSTQFEGTVISTSGSGATIRVVSLITHDRQFGCRTWSGSYRMTRRSGRWLIARADIHPRRCGT